VKRWTPLWLQGTILGIPALFLIIFFVAPLALLIVFSFFQNVPGGGYVRDFTIENYVRLLKPLYLGRLGFTIWISALTAFASLAIGFPFTYFIVRLASPRLQSLAIGTVVSTLWLTYVVRAFGWSVLLSRSGGVGKLLAWLGLVEIPPSYTPGFAATFIGFVYVYLPFMILSLYGSLRGLSRELEEASISLGANWWQTLRKIVVPLALPGMMAGSLLVFLLAIGTYVVPVILGKPQQWTLPVLITDQVLYESNIPFGAALSIVLVLIVGVLLIGFGRLLRGGGVLRRG